MQIDLAMSACLEAALNELIIVAEVGGIQGASEGVVREILPGHRKAKHVQAICVDEVAHLSLAIVGQVGTVRRRNVVDRRVHATNVARTLIVAEVEIEACQCTQSISEVEWTTSNEKGFLTSQSQNRRC